MKHPLIDLTGVLQRSTESTAKSGHFVFTQSQLLPKSRTALDQSNPLVQLPLITEYNENNFSVELEYEVVLDKYPRWRFERASPCYENTCRIIVPLTQASVRNESMDVITSLYRKGNREKQTYKFKTIHGEGRKQSNIKGLGCFAFSEFVYLIITIPLGRTVE